MSPLGLLAIVTIALGYGFLVGYVVGSCVAQRDNPYRDYS